MRSRTKKGLPLQEGEGKRKSGAIMGIDVHKSILAICILNEASFLYEQNHSNDKSGLETILKLIKKYKVQDVAMEATSTYHLKVCFALVDSSVPVLLACARQTADTQGKKTDKLDARRIALAHRDGRLQPSVISPKEFTHLRRSTRKLTQLIQEQTKSKQRVQQLFQLYDCRLTSLHKNLLKTKWSLNLLIACLEMTEEETHKNIKELVMTYYPKTKLKKTTNYQIGTLQDELEHLITQLSLVERINLQTELFQIRIFEQLIEQHRLVYRIFAKQHPGFNNNMKILLSIPGVGPDTAAIVLAEIVDIKLFSKPEKLVKWSGLAPRILQSGHRKKITGKIHKGGNKHMRRSLTLACTNIYARGDVTNPIHLFIKKKYQEKDIYWVAVCAGSRKLLSIIWLLLTYQKEWKPDTITKPEIYQRIQTAIQSKIRSYTLKVDNYHQLQSELTELLNTNVSELENSIHYIKKLNSIFNLVL